MYGKRILVKSLWLAVRRCKHLGLDIDSPFIRCDNYFTKYNHVWNFYQGTHVYYKQHEYKIVSHNPDKTVTLKNGRKVIDVPKNTIITSLQLYPKHFTYNYDRNRLKFNT